MNVIPFNINRDSRYIQDIRKIRNIFLTRWWEIYHLVITGDFTEWNVKVIIKTVNPIICYYIFYEMYTIFVEI